jgi:predicted lipid-binding transport protein (Tim44 family)
MKRLGSAALISLLSTLSVVGLVGLVACENSSRLDSSAKNVPKEKADKPAAAFKGDHSGSLEDRVARLEANYDKNAEAFDFLAKVYDQQKAQQQRAQREEPDPDAVFAVDVAPDVKLGAVEGPNSALVTIVEAWDFA